MSSGSDPNAPKPALVKTGKKCPQCRGALIVREGQHGKFISCVNYPGCKYTEPLPEDIVGRACPDCGGVLVYRNGTKGRFISCSNFPTCKHSEPIPEDVVGRACPDCGGPLVYRNGSKGRFISCSNYPKCTHKEQYYPKIGVKCPECGGEIVEITTKDESRVFFGCENYPTCRFTSSLRPIADPCPNCGPKGFLVLVSEKHAHCRVCQKDFIDNSGGEAEVSQ